MQLWSPAASAGVRSSGFGKLAGGCDDGDEKLFHPPGPQPVARRDGCGVLRVPNRTGIGRLDKWAGRALSLQAERASFSAPMHSGQMPIAGCGGIDAALATLSRRPHDDTEAINPSTARRDGSFRDVGWGCGLRERRPGCSCAPWEQLGVPHDARAAIMVGVRKRSELPTVGLVRFAPKSVERTRELASRKSRPLCALFARSRRSGAEVRQLFCSTLKLPI